jgi:hypothetical protein
MLGLARLDIDGTATQENLQRLAQSITASSRECKVFHLFQAGAAMQVILADIEHHHLA